MIWDHKHWSGSNSEWPISLTSLRLTWPYLTLPFLILTFSTSPAFATPDVTLPQLKHTPHLTSLHLTWRHRTSAVETSPPLTSLRLISFHLTLPRLTIRVYCCSRNWTTFFHSPTIWIGLGMSWRSSIFFHPVTVNSDTSRSWVPWPCSLDG